MSLLQESDSDVGSHHVAMVAALFYNVGLNNDEITGHNFFKQGGKFNKLKADIEATFTNNHGIQIALICEFGNMFTCVDTQIAKACSSGLMKQRDGRQQGVQYASTKELFEGILVELDLMYVTVIAQPAYVALIDTRFWRIITCEPLSGICSTITRNPVHFCDVSTDTCLPLLPPTQGKQIPLENCVKSLLIHQALVTPCLGSWEGTLTLPQAE